MKRNPSKVSALAFALLLMLLIFSACGAQPEETAEPAPESTAAEVQTDEAAEETAEEPEEEAAVGEYQWLSQDDAKALMDSEDVIVLDVRTQSEYDSGHIENAVLLPNTEIAQKVEEVIPDKSTTVLVYCRSGNRSRSATTEMAEMGYTNVYDFGGINDWQYEVVQ